MATPISDFYKHLPMIEVLPEVTSRSMTSKKTGEISQVRTQVGYLVQVDAYGAQLRRQVRINLNRDQAPYAPGAYMLDGISLNGNQWGDLELQRFSLALYPIPPELKGLVEQEQKRAA